LAQLIKKVFMQQSIKFSGYRDLFIGSGYIEIDENLNLTLNDKGRQDCENEQMQ
jgi:hypothetical protein